MKIYYQKKKNLLLSYLMVYLHYEYTLINFLILAQSVCFLIHAQTVCCLVCSLYPCTNCLLVWCVVCFIHAQTVRLILRCCMLIHAQTVCSCDVLLCFCFLYPYTNCMLVWCVVCFFSHAYTVCSFFCIMRYYVLHKLWHILSVCLQLLGVIHGS